MLHVQSVDLHYEKNKSDHHTSDYFANDYKSSQLIVRRGQAFQITLVLNRPLKAEDDVTFAVETGKSPDVVKGTRANFSLSTKEVTRARWRASTYSTASSSVIVSITPPVTAVIGAYKLSVNFFSGGYTSHNTPGFILLFNPWALDDEVYLADESEREEYVLKDRTIIYSGDESDLAQQGWNLGQFEEGILLICLFILSKQQMVDASLFHDPKEVAKVCCAMLNNEDKGVIQGNWSGNYDGGRSPRSWSGSVTILKEWHKHNFAPVRYGQCWVFAGVLCTVMRCLGIPSRIVTNFSSGHDTNKNLSVDIYYDHEGNNLGDVESIWNFHVWNEVWFSREDLGSHYDGWQVLDAAPYPLKVDGICRLGPTSVKAIKNGDLYLNYDGPFVFAEVNADKNAWIFHEKGESYERVETSIRSIGKCISTKAVGSNHREDITYSYKYEEGSAEEREAYHNALLHLHGRRTIAEDERHPASVLARMSRVRPSSKQYIRGGFKDIDAPEIGQDIDLTLLLVNAALSEKAIKLNLNASVTSYTRRVMTKIVNESVSTSIPANTDVPFPFKIPYNKYKDHLQEDQVVEVTALCQGEETGKLLISRIITLKTPPIKIKVLGNPVLHKLERAEITFRNPLNETLSNCEVSVEGGGLLKEPFETKVSLQPKEEITVVMEFTPYTYGLKQLNAVVHWNKIVTLNGFVMVDVNCL